MRYFHNDYNEMCHSAVLAAMNAQAGVQSVGYGVDEGCKEAANRIRKLCGNDQLSVHFLVGGTQTNLTVIAAALRPYQGVISVDSGHINVHETGAIEATGHKVIALPGADGKLQADQIDRVVREQKESGDAEHIVQPKMVYISHPTELGTIYSKEELTAISQVCKAHGLYLFVDGARLGYGLAAADADLTLADLAALTDVFYIGGTKVGAMFGEAVVISNPALATDFRYLIKQKGGMLAKGWLLGVQFNALLQNDLYLQISAHADALADRLRDKLAKCGYSLLVQSRTNQVFPILPDSVLEKISPEFTFAEMHRVDETHRAVRFCTSWATKEEDVAALCRLLEETK